MRRQSEYYLVFICPRCGAIRYAKEGTRTAECFGCGFHVPIIASRVQILFRTTRREEAIEFVKRYKMNLGRKRLNLKENKSKFVVPDKS